MSATATPPDDEDLIIFSYSEIDTFRQCPLKHQLAYVWRYSKSVKPGSALAKGSLWHLVMQEHYRLIRTAQSAYRNKRIPKADEAAILASIREMIKWIWEPVDGKQTDDQALVEWMYNGYVEKWGADREWKILGIEQQIRVPFLDEQGEPTRYLLKANLDLIIWSWETASKWVVDHKSAGDMPDMFELELYDQFPIYSWMLGQVGSPVTGAIHSAARTKRNMGDYPDAELKHKPQTLDQRFRRTYMNHPQEELDNIALDMYNAAVAAWPPPGMVRSRYSAPNPKECKWKCDFKDVHIQARKGRRDIHDIATDFGFRINRERH